MALYEVPFTSVNGRDEIQAWVYTPISKPRAVVQIIHGLGEHSRRYLPIITKLLDAGFVVAADDHSGHGRTAMAHGTWGDSGENAASVVVSDELALQKTVRAMYPELPYVVFGHSWGSMIARGMAANPQAVLDGLVLCGIAAQMEGIETQIDRASLREVATGSDGAQPVPEQFLGGVFAGFTERFGPDAGPTDWVASDAAVVADHAIDPHNNFGAPLTARFLHGFVELYDQANGDDFYDSLPQNLPILILAGDQDPVTNYGEGAYHVANKLVRTGHPDVRTRVFTGMRHEVHNEPESREETMAELLTFLDRVVAPGS